MPDPILYDISDIPRNLRKLNESVPASGRRIKENGEVVNLADLAATTAGGTTAIAADVADIKAANQSILAFMQEGLFRDQRQARVGDFVYFGYTNVLGAATSDTSWVIIRSDETNWPDELVLRAADAELTFDKVWDDKATYTYAA